MNFFKKTRDSADKRRSRKSIEKADIPSRQSSLSTRQVEVPERRASLDQADLVVATSSLSLGDGVKEQREALVSKIVSTARQNVSTLDPAGRKVFEAARLPLKKGSLDVTTRWVQPIIQETVIPREHVETTTVIHREIHTHHVYPKIQPVSDPEPLILETRHRICGPDGRWHEVVGDAAAIEILGEEAFYGGKKEIREKRNLALPGFRPEDKGVAVWADKDGQYSYDTGEQRTLSMAI